MDYWNGFKGPKLICNHTFVCAMGHGQPHRKGVLLIMCGKIESMEGSCVRISPGVDSAYALKQGYTPVKRQSYQ